MVKCESLAELEKLISLVASPLIVCHSKSGKIFSSNETASDLTGYSSDEVKGLSIGQLFSEASQSIIQAVGEISNTSSGAIKIKEDHLAIRRRTGRSCFVSMSVSSCTIDSEKYLIFTMQDLTEVKKQEEERKKLMEETAQISKLADIGRLTAGMAHELNNPLAILMGYLENLSSNIRDGELGKDSLLEDIVPVERAAQRMSKVIAKMLAKMRNEKHVSKTLPLKKIVDEALVLLEGILASQSIQLTVEVEDSWVDADATSIEQILTNIMTNAINALDSQKERKITIKSTVKNQMVYLEIWNNGKSIPTEVQSKLFTPFFTTKGAGEGTGLGLYMSYQIMKAHSGDVSFYSDDKKGTAFTLSFPQVQKPQATVTAKMLKALVVDDDTFFRKLMCKKLEKLQFVCDEARDGQEAMRILNQRREDGDSDFDMILVDFKMPKMDGLELVTKLQEANFHLPVVLISGSLSLAELQLAAKNYPLFASISKPVESAELQLLAEKIAQKSLQKKAA